MLNTTTISGLAGRTAEALKERGFQISATTSGLDRYEDKVAVVLAGPKGYAQALTIQRQVPGSEFVYEFKATPAGTHWYHSHVGVQYGNGLFGPLIVEGPQAEHRPGHAGVHRAAVAGNRPGSR